MSVDLPTLTAAYALALTERGASPAYATKSAQIVRRAGADPAGFLRARSASWSAATLADARNRLQMFGKWLAETEGASLAEPWRSLPSLAAGKAERPKAVFAVEEVQALLSCAEIPAHRRVLYRVLATLGLRPVEASRLEASHLIRQGRGYLLRLPATSQKSGRADALSVSEAEARLILAHLPLVRRGLGHFEETFQRDLMRARVPIKQGEATRRLYDLRAFCGSQLLRSGADLETVRHCMRHADIRTTLRFYAAHRAEDAGAKRREAFRGLRTKIA